MKAWIGTSGWQYRDWRGAFYPAEAKQVAWLEHYAQRFRTVELNNSFYRLPSRETFEQWARRTPDDFVLAVKASRYLSHLKRLVDPAEPVARLLRSATGLGGKLGPVLVQLPERFHRDTARLAAALDEFPAAVRVAVELRHDSWWRDDVYEVLAAHGAALCWADRGSRWITPRQRTAAWGYVRFHWGLSSPQPCYAPQTLAARARDLAAAWPGDDDDVYVYFNNDPRCCAVRDAELFARACDRLPAQRTRVPAAGEVRVVR